MVSEVLFHIGNLPVTAYGLGMALALAAVAVLAALAAKRKGYSPQVVETFLLLVIPLGVLLARAAYVLIRLNFFVDWGEGLLFRFWQGGYSVWGVILSFFLACWGCARLLKLDHAALTDFLASYGLLFLALARFCEGLSGQGFGQEASAALTFFPFAVVNEYEEWRYAIFMLEGAAALVFIWRLGALRAKPGDRARLALLLFCAFQILFESLRADEVLSWGFVKASQLISAVVIYLLMIDGLYIRCQNRWKGPRHLAQAVFFLLIFMIVGLEFAIDKTGININLIYTVMLGCCLGLYLLTRRCILTRPER